MTFFKSNMDIVSPLLLVLANHIILPLTEQLGLMINLG
uniref:Uncharacterized protein n=1 Tax=Anguilla anguilla TaxID=7936 RepID=A0A0E9UJR8_ANGAN